MSFMPFGRPPGGPPRPARVTRAQGIPITSFSTATPARPTFSTGTPARPTFSTATPARPPGWRPGPPVRIPGPLSRGNAGSRMLAARLSQLQ
jgi:hypothetical protein